MKLNKNKLLTFLKYLAILFFASTIFMVVLYRFVNPPLTSLMIIRWFEHDGKNGDFRFEKKWVSLDDISRNMVLAVVAAEDNNFATHFGVDWEAVEKARQINKYSRIKHGASTITQQTAKNVFLFPSRTWIRKGLELYFTYLIEIFWSKERIMEVYLNVIEMGRGIYGVEAASQCYFHKPAIDLTKTECAMFTAVLPRPLKRNPSKPTGYMRGYQSRVLKLMDMIGKVEL
jgi:monofunctional biosynthetic peptidoglycan transglycosylase